MMGRVRAPGAPALGEVCHLAKGGSGAETRQCAANAEIARGERVGVAQSAHRHVLGGPRADAAHSDEPGAHRVAIATGVELEPPVRDESARLP